MVVKRSKKNRKSLIVKPPLSEIFAALTGIACAAISLVQKGVDTKEDALTDLGFRAVLKSIDMKKELVCNNHAETQEALAKDALEFLAAGGSVLVWYPDVVLTMPSGAQKGKRAKLLLDHIDDMIEREKGGDGERRIEKVRAGAAGLVTVFNAPYLPPSAKKGRQNAADTEDVLDEGGRSSPPRSGRKKDYGWSRRDSALV